MRDPKLDAEEKALLQSLEADEWQSVPNLAAEKKRMQQAARNTLNKTKRINLRVTQRDFDAAHVKAIEEGIPYQTLLASIVHKYLSGRLVEKSR